MRDQRYGAVPRTNRTQFSPLLLVHHRPQITKGWTVKWPCGRDDLWSVAPTPRGSKLSNATNPGSAELNA